MSLEDDALNLHSKNPGKISVENSVKIKDKEDLNLVYTPGVAEPCKKIDEDKNNSYKYTSRKNLVGVVSDGSAVLGLGDIGPEASMPVMEGKANLLKKFGDVDGFPICLNAENSEEVIDTVEKMAPTFGAINLEDIKAPECFEIEAALKDKLDIPVFHDDQHGTAVVVGAALKNAFKLKDKEIKDAKIVVVGAGASGVAVSNFILNLGVENLLVVDSKGIISSDKGNSYKKDLAKRSNSDNLQGGLKEAFKNADAVIGLSAGGLFNKELVGTMAKDPIVFALANPDPEILPSEAKEAGAFITATGRSDFKNQVNNSLAFPGIFRGAIDAQAKEINEEMKKSASEAIANFIKPEKDKIVPETLDRELAMKIADEVEKTARKTAETRE